MSEQAARECTRNSPDTAISSITGRRTRHEDDLLEPDIWTISGKLPTSQGLVDTLE
jgi:hypothetical protein